MLKYLVLILWLPVVYALVWQLIYNVNYRLRHRPKSDLFAHWGWTDEWNGENYLNPDDYEEYRKRKPYKPQSRRV